MGKINRIPLKLFVVASVVTKYNSLYMAEIEILKTAVDIDVAAQVAADHVVDRLGTEPRTRKIVLLGILKGALPWMFKVIDKLPPHYGRDSIEMAFMRLSSYEGTASTGKIKWNLCGTNIEDFDGADVVVFEDVVDTGKSLEALMTYFAQAHCNSINYVIMADKTIDPQPSQDTHASFRFEPDDFLVGLGLDYNEKYRTLNYIGRLCDTS